MTNFQRSLILGTSLLALAGCGPDDLSSPGTGGNVNVNINNPAPGGGTGGNTGSATAATACPNIGATTQLTAAGTLSNSTGSYLVCRLPANIDRDTTLPAGTASAALVYELPGRVDVGCDGGLAAPTTAAPFTTTTASCGGRVLTADTNVTLTIQPGAIVFGGTGISWLAVNRGNKINAVGTASKPIIFTSRANIDGTATEDSQGQWGGVVLLGRGKITDCGFGSTATNTCERDTEGAADPARFGGNDDTYNAGNMQYVQIRFSGFTLSADKELQSLTPSGVGTGTTLDNILSYNSSDDGMEIFGGAANIKHYISIGADDDSLDVDTGARANVQYALLIQRAGGSSGDALFEIDSNANEDATPRTVLKVANFTGIQRRPDNSDDAASLFRGNADTTLVNGIIHSPSNECIRLNGSGSTANRATLTARSVVLTCSTTKYIGTGSYTAADVQTAFGSGTNNNNDAFTSTLATDGFTNGTNENGVTATDPKTVAAFFDTTTFIGALRASDTWTQGWTCNSVSANFGTGNTGSCASLPTS